MKNKIPNPGFFSGNRQKLMEKLPENSLAIIAANNFMPKTADQNYPFYQNQSFFYLTGLQQEKAILCLCKSHPDPEKREVLFILKTTPQMQIWSGHRYTPDEARGISGVKTIMHLESFEQSTSEFMALSKYVFMLTNEYPGHVTEFATFNDLLIEKMKKHYPLHAFERLTPLLNDMRLMKQPEELNMMKHAIDITGKALRRVLKTVRPGLFEYQIVAEISHEISWNGGNGHAFDPIVASGKNACVLHYTTPFSKLDSGSLLLLDFGAEYGYYASDCSRTVPVNGKFSKRQKECYEAVLRVFKKASGLYIPGNTILEINRQVNQWMEEEMLHLGLFTQKQLKAQNPENPLYKKYFMHGTAHFVGLDVHDSGFRHTPLQKGMVLTCEPGLYIEEENMGIRIETMILVDDHPVDLMKSFPVEVSEIEKMMKK
jgi:Xaa-Pro aminopeptidase